MDLYEFPSDYIGRKTYVHVDGHSKSVPYLYTYKGTDGKNHILPEYGGTEEFFAHGEMPYFVPGIKSFRSPIDGTLINSRTALSDHERRHNVVQIGNERIEPPADRAPMPRAGYDVKRALETVKG